MSETPKGEELGTITVASNDGLQAALKQFREAVAKAGGDFGKIDQVATHFNVSRTAPTNCTGVTVGPSAPCTGSEVVVAEIDLYGRAFRVAGATPGGQ
jgi:hypothetical protein